MAGCNPREFPNDYRHDALKTQSRWSKSPRKSLLTAHHTDERWHGQAAGNLSFFGARKDPSAEAAEYLAGWEDLQAGRPARWTSSGSRSTTADTMNRSLDRCRQRVEFGRLAGITLLDDPAMRLRMAHVLQSELIHGQRMLVATQSSNLVAEIS